MKKFLGKSGALLVGLMLVSVTLVGCQGTDSQTKSTESKETAAGKSANDLEKTAEKNAKTVLSYVYQGKKDGLQKVTNQSADEVDAFLTKELVDKQLENYNDGDKLDDYFLMIDGSHYYASDILDTYAKAYIKATHALGEFEIKSVKVDGDEAEVVAEITPFAGLSEANPIGQMKVDLFGGLDEASFISKSQNKDIKAIQNLITLKLYAMYYGDRGNIPEKSSEKKEVHFNMEKKGDSFMVSNDVMNQLAKESRDKTYAKTSDSSSEDSVEKITEDTSNSL